MKPQMSIDMLKYIGTSETRLEILEWLERYATNITPPPGTMVMNAGTERPSDRIREAAREIRQLRVEIAAMKPPTPVMQTNIPRLCYVKENWAYFTTQEVTKQWGDDWDDAPYEHNAESPYEWRDDSDKEKWTITKVAFEGEFSVPCSDRTNSSFSVKEINHGAIAWLRPGTWSKHDVIIRAGTTLDDFIVAVKKAGGKVYREVV